MDKDRYLRLAKELLAGNGNVRNTIKIPDFEAIIEKMTKFSKNLGKS